MPKPWEKYQKQEALNKELKPWEKYQKQESLSKEPVKEPVEEPSFDMEKMKTKALGPILGSIYSKIPQDIKDQVRDKALDIGARTLDLTGGLVRTLLYAPTGVVTPKDALNALQGKAPYGSEYLKRIGAPDIVAKPLGFASDMVMDITLSNLYKGGAKVLKGLSSAMGKKAAKETAETMGKKALTTSQRGLKPLTTSQTGIKPFTPSQQSIKPSITNKRATKALATNERGLRPITTNKQGIKPFTVNERRIKAKVYEPEFDTKFKSTNESGYKSNFKPDYEPEYEDITKAAEQAKKKGVNLQELLERIQIRPVSEGISKAGEKLVRSGLKNVDNDLLRYGASPMSDLVLKYNLSGTNKNIMNKSADILEEGNKVRKAIYNKVKGKTMVDPDKVFGRARKEVMELIKAEGPAEDIGLKLLEDLNRWDKGKPLTIEQVNKWKRIIADKVNFDQSSKSNAYQRFAQEFGAGIKEGIEEAVRKVDPELAGQLIRTNREAQTLLTARKALLREAKKETTRDYITSIDLLLFGIDPTSAAFKKTGDLMKSTWFRTRSGQALRKAGKTPLADKVVKRGLIQAGKED